MTGADAVLVRDLAVRVRLARGALSLRLGEDGHVLPPELAWVWRRPEGVTTVAGLLDEAGTDQREQVAALLTTLVERGFLRPVGST